MSSSMLAYGADYGSDTRNQTSGMGSYNAGMMMYNVPHTAAQQSVYDTQQFTPRQHAAMQMMPSDVASTYFAGSEGATNTGSSSLQTSAQNSSSSPSVYQQHNPGLSYSSNMSGSNNNNNHNHSSSSSSEMHHQAGGSHHQQQQQAPATTASAGAAADNREFPNDDTTAEKWSSFQRQLGALFQEISNGQLERAAEALLSISTWMLSQVVELGLHQDNQALHEDRLRVWNDFNHAWLALAFQQKELMASGRQVSRSQRLMSEEAVKKLGDELIRLCDGIERHGLVDYQYGVWEEQIEAGSSFNGRNKKKA
ncbi:hypothetical protein AAL_07482 [Moelleriella libera RCEF 2490]|uniref:Uncharacterized protein n=1 Tax=Moelleriella libera RCEF 2490 TaxID=1081109 RepID=A0A167XE75_9HYPO|nr:hypothetical protein AAL_07482 [Moelleriella libera RCEF 2490]